NPQLIAWKEEKTKNINCPWSAVTMNLAIRCSTPIYPLYHQIHLPTTPSWASSNSLFVSFSDIEDRKRAPTNWQTVTISTHVRPKDFPSRDSHSYALLKEEIELELLNILKANFKGIEESKFI